MDLRVEPEDRYLAAIAFAKPLQAFDGGGFARPVGANDPEDLAGLDFERNAVDCLDLSIPLLQPTNEDC